MRHPHPFARLPSALAALSLCVPALSQPYPSKPIRMIVPLAAGGSSDIDGRMIAEKLTLALGQSVFVENRTGASTDIGIGTLARSAPDGYTIGVVPVSSMATGTLVRKLPYDPLKDLAPISGMTITPLVIVTSGSSPYLSLNDVVAGAKSKPGALSFGSIGIGSSAHLAGELLKMMAGIDLLHVPYKGASEANAAVLAGQIDLSISAASGISAHVRSGKLRPLAVTDGKRVSSMPDVPSVAEFIPGYSAGVGGLSLFAPAGTPPAIIARLNAEVGRALSQPDVLKRIAAAGEEPDPTTPEQVAAKLRAEIQKWSDLVRASGLRLQ